MASSLVVKKERLLKFFFDLLSFRINSQNQIDRATHKTDIEKGYKIYILLITFNRKRSNLLTQNSQNL